VAVGGIMVGREDVGGVEAAPPLAFSKSNMLSCRLLLPVPCSTIGIHCYRMGRQSNLGEAK